jgi:hypothetical protein
VLLPGKLRSRYHGSDDSDTVGVTLPHEVIVFWGICQMVEVGGGVGCTSTTSTMASPDGVVQQGFGDGRGVMGSHRVASMAGLPKATWSSSLKMDHKLMEVTASELSGVHRESATLGFYSCF